MTVYDHAVIVFYVGFMLAVGVVFRGLNQNTSDYFRCGGAMPWWITGTSAWLATFSAWAFVGAASEVYRSGLKVLLLFWAALPALLVVALHTGVRFRRLQVVTWIEAVRARFGPASEQFYTWLKVPIELLKAGVALMTISVFAAAVLDAPLNPVIVVLGVTITLVAFAGGAFAVLASDFVQMLLVMTVAVLTVFLTLRQPEIGGLGGLVEKVAAQQPAHFQIWQAFRPVILVGWGVAFAAVKFAESNSLEAATMYLMPKDETHARRMALIPFAAQLVGPFFWCVPPLAATILFPDLGAQFPGLAKPTEAAFVAVALKVMPVGLLGLLLCAMLGATLTNMDAAVNKSVGVFVRSFYHPVLRPAASERSLLVASKACTLIFGALIIACALLINAHRTSDVFTLLNQMMVSLGLPLTLPIFFGLFFRRTPDWSAWVTALVCFAYSAWCNFVFAPRLEAPGFAGTLPAFLQYLLGEPARTLTASERSDLLLIVTALGTLALGALVFFGSAFFHRHSAPEHHARVNEFFQRLRTPLRASRDAPAVSDEPVYRLLGGLCLGYGAFVLLLMLIPNPPVGRLCFLFVGSVIGGAGWILRRIAIRKRAGRVSA